MSSVIYSVRGSILCCHFLCKIDMLEIVTDTVQYSLLVTDITKTGSKPFLKGAWSKHSNVEHERLLLRVKRKAEQKPTSPEHSVTISTLHTGYY